jgi:arsenite methyltransferase
MTDGLQFDEDLRRAMEMAYLTPDIAAARSEVIKALNVQVGESVLDIGSGPGFLAKDLAERVGPTGSTHGIDLAENMIEAGRKLCASQPWAEFQCGDAMSLPYPDASFDAVVSTQVYEYVPDLEGALSEFGRVMRPGGRGIIVDTDWSAPYWNATDTSIRDRIIDAWAKHCAQESVPMRLSGAIRSANLEIKQIIALPLFNYRYDENAFSYWVPKIIGSFALGRNGIEQKDIDAWLAGLEQLEEKGDYFFCINRYLFEVIK